MAKFKVGDMVRILDGSRISNYCGGWTDEMAKHVGEVHKVESVDSGDFGEVKIYLYGFRVLDYNYTWDERGLEYADKRKIFITSDGKTTIAALYDGENCVKTAKADCSPEDTFSLAMGAKLSLDRLFGEKQTKEEPRAEPKAAAPDNINHPSHYETNGVECIVAMEAAQGAEATQAFCICNAFKYIWRHKHKNGAEDIRKAVWYLNKWLDLEGRGQHDEPTEIHNQT